MSTARDGRQKSTDSALVLRSILEKLKNHDLKDKLRLESVIVKTHGGYADVFVGYMRWGDALEEIKVAVKRLRIHIQGDVDFAKMISKEIRVWSNLHHPNVLAFLGYALEGDGYPLLVSEWMENGTAMTYVHQHPDCDVTRMVLGIAEGLAYLHSQDVVHADMKADNILVGDEGQPRICDFGISSVLSASASFGASSHVNGAKGSLRWMAPDFFDMSEPPAMHTKKTDVWAFGMTVYELLTKQMPYAHIRLDPQVLLAIVSYTLPPHPEASDIESKPLYEKLLWRICLDCWHRSPEERPRMSSIVEWLDFSSVTDREGLIHEDNRHGDESSPGVDELTEQLLVSDAEDVGWESIYEPESEPQDVDNASLYISSPMSGATAVDTPYFGTSPSRVFDSISTFGLEEAIVKEGYLAEVTDSSIYRLYTTKYFVLHPSYLRCYRTKNGELLGSVDVVGAQLLDQPPTGRVKGRQSPFILFTRRTMGLSEEPSLRVLHSDSRSESEEWVSALRYTAKGLIDGVPPPQEYIMIHAHGAVGAPDAMKHPLAEARRDVKRISGTKVAKIMTSLRRVLSRNVS